MEAKVAIPVKGQPLHASWAAAVANRVNATGAMVPSGGLAREGVTGTGFGGLPQNRRDRHAAADHPWKIYGGMRPESSSQPSKAQRVYVPAESLVVFGTAWSASSIIGLSADGSFADVYEMACLEALEEDESAIVHLFVYREKDEPEDDSATQGETSPAQTFAEVALSLDDSETFDPSDHEILAAVPIAKVTLVKVEVEVEERDMLKIDLQYQRSAISVGGATSAGVGDVGCWSIDGLGDTDYPANRYVNVGAKTYHVEESNCHHIGSCKGKILAVKAEQSWAGPNVETATYDSFAALQAAQNESPRKAIIPIWQLSSEGKIAVDFRNAPKIQVFEVITGSISQGGGQ